MKFGQYELLEPIAIGGMAEVFKGRVVAAEGFEKYVAIKRILPDLAADERFVKMLLTEARIHSALSHRNIVQIHDLGISENGEYFIVLEYVEGYDLRIITEQLGAENEIIPEALSLYIAAEVAEGLHFAHEMRGPDGQPLGLVHRDVTPSNVLISFAGEVKLSDFGLAKRRHDSSVVGSLKGNLAYMSPEQAKQAPLDRRTDIFSLGALLFELLTGRRLREITDEIAGWSQVASGVVPSARRLRPDLPVVIERLLDVALAAEPEHRFPDAATFGAAIRDALGKLNVAVGASDLAALLGVISPPKRPRQIMLEPSKVIRLGSEAQALHEAIAAPTTPAPVVAPGLTPAASRMNDRAVVRFRDPSATPEVEVHPPAESRDPMATPPPDGPLPPARARGYTPAGPSAHEAARLVAPTPAGGQRPVGERVRKKTTPGGGARPVGGPVPRTLVDNRPGRGSGPIAPGGAPPSARGSGPHAPVGTPPLRGTGPQAPVGTPRGTGPQAPVGAPPARGSGAYAPVGARTVLGANLSGDSGRMVSGGAVGAQQPARGSGPVPRTLVDPGSARAGAPAAPSVPRGPLYRTPSYGVQRPSREVFAVGPAGVQPVAPAGVPPSARDGAHAGVPPRRPSGGFDFTRVQHDTARVQIRSRGRWLGRLFWFVVLLGGAAAGVHFYLIPLEVLAAWREPASLSIATDPNGATLRLDGAPVSGTTPATVRVQRDRAEHLIEATHPGYLPARQTVRYDKSLGLAFVLHLEKDPAVPPPAPATGHDGTAAAGPDGGLAARPR
jgi:serine/threonine-protein kinase